MIGAKTADVEAFWERLRGAFDIADSDYHACSFADPALSRNVDKIGRLAVAGNKRATAHLALDFEINGVRRREPGDYWVVVGSAGNPLCLVRVTRVEVAPFNAVEVGLAVTEGEGDLSLEYWRGAHRPYFERQLAQWGRAWRDDLPVVCEYFDLIWPEAESAA